MPEDNPSEVAELLTLGPFGGIDPTTDPLLVAPQNFIDASNFVPNENYGGFKLVEGRINAIFGLLPSVPNGMHCFHRQGEPDVYIFACDVPNLRIVSGGASSDQPPLEGALFYAQLGQAPVRLELPSASDKPALTAGQPTKFADAQSWCFVTNGKDTPLKIDQDLNVTYWGIVAPTTVPTVDDVGPGVLVGTYYYCTTFGNDTQESSQGVISDPITFTSQYATGTLQVSGEVKTNTVLYLTAGALGVGQATTSFTVAANTDGSTPSIYQVASGFAAAITSDPVTSQFVLAQASVPDADNFSVASIVLTSTTPGADGNFTFFFGDKDPDTTMHIGPKDETLLSGGQDGGTARLSNFPIPTDPQVTEINVYRLGGSLGTWNLVQTITLGLPDEPVPWYDFIHDDDVTGQELVVNRDPPPPFAYICTHMERIFGFVTPDDPSVSWWSNLNEPWGFNAADNTFTCGDNKLGDVGVGMMELGGVLAMMKSRRVYWVYGSTDVDFQPIFGFFIGCDAPLSVATGYGLGFWHGRQGVHMTNGQGYQNISDGSVGQSNVKAILDSLSTDDFAKSCGFIYDRQYYLSFPTQAFTLLFDTRTNNWFKLSMSTPLAVFDLDGEVSVVAAGEAQNKGQVVQWFASPTDLGGPITGTLTSRIAYGGMAQARKQLRYGIIQAPVQSGVRATVQTLMNPTSASQLSDSIDLDLGYGVTAQRWSMATPTGTQVQTRLSITSSVGATFSTLSVYGWAKSLFSPGDEEPPIPQAEPAPPQPPWVWDEVKWDLAAWQ